jgi:hypothetical protein
MPHRRRVEKGSFGGQLDELIKVFEKDPPSSKFAASKGEPRNGDECHINDKLFERAWRRKRED